MNNLVVILALDDNIPVQAPARIQSIHIVYWMLVCTSMTA